MEIKMKRCYNCINSEEEIPQELEEFIDDEFMLFCNAFGGLVVRMGRCDYHEPKSEDLIPHGIYCYHRDENNKITLCPYHSFNDEKPEQMNGHCSYLNRGDWEEGLSHLFDHVKECGINDEIFNEDLI